MGKANMVSVNTQYLGHVLQAKKLPVSEMAKRLGHSDSWGYDLMRTGRCKTMTAEAIAYMLGINIDLLCILPAKEAAEETVKKPDYKAVADEIREVITLVEEISEKLRVALEMFDH